MNNLERGFINKEDILRYVSEQDIFSLVFKFKPEEYQYTTSPFRDDKKPGCWFQYSPSNSLRFVDFANSEVKSGIRMSNIDCFDAVMVYFNLSNFYETLKFIKEKLIDGKSIKNDIVVIKPKIKKEVRIDIQPKPFNNKDKRFWQKYGISSLNLIEDGVVSVRNYRMFNTRLGNSRVIFNQNLCYAYTKFFDIENNNQLQNKIKIYRPLCNGKGKFLTTCGANEVGGLEYISEGDSLIISKSYKDCRVLRNFGYNCIWFQNEGMIPSARILTNICSRYKNIIVFFDNDTPGINAAIKVQNEINKFYPNRAKIFYLPCKYLLKYGVKDPSDMYCKMGKNNLEKNLKDIEK